MYEGKLTEITGAAKRSRDCSCIGTQIQAADAGFYQKVVDDATYFQDPAICYWDRGGNDGTGGCCTPCEVGGQCEGGNISMYNLDGFYQQEDNNNVRQDFFYECSPASACLSCDDACNKRNEKCREDTEKGILAPDSRGITGHCQQQCYCDSFSCYSGDNCATCAKSIQFQNDHQDEDVANFFRQDGDCVRCPVQNPATLVITGLLFLFLCILWLPLLNILEGWVLPEYS